MARMSDMPILPVATLRPRLNAVDWSIVHGVVTRHSRLREYEFQADPETRYLWKWVCLNVSPCYEHHDFPASYVGAPIPAERRKRLDELVCELVSLVPREQRHGMIKHKSLRILTEGTHARSK